MQANSAANAGSTMFAFDYILSQQVDLECHTSVKATSSSDADVFNPLEQKNEDDFVKVSIKQTSNEDLFENNNSHGHSTKEKSEATPDALIDHGSQVRFLLARPF
jgi:hypothetical protein